jgi:asparagine synthase (glutamine-hydrolysing)
LAENAGVVLGTLFERGSQTALATRTLQTTPSDLIASYWGRYVAFIAHERSGKKSVLRDPMGGLPCFHTERSGVVVLFSLLQDCLQLGLGDFSINWRYVTMRAAVGPFHSKQTALNEIAELQPGGCLTLEGSRLSSDLLWNPQKIALSDPIEDPQAAATQLRSTCKTSVHAWASCHDSIIHRLSGGLDSSIVMGCLQDAPTRPRMTSHVYYHPKFSQTDPRYFARLSAARAGCELLERDRSQETFRFEELMSIALSAKPLPHLAHLETSAWERSLAADRQATAIFSGDGGDPLFCRFGKDHTVSDYILRHGIRPHAFRLAFRMAPLVQMSLWALLLKSFRRNLHQDEGIVSPRGLVTAAASRSVSQSDDYLHPWFRSHPDIGPGKLLHIRLALYFGQPSYRPAAELENIEEVHPLLSQPLIELSLRIPTYVHLASGRERGLARQAFEPDVPGEILNRFWKGRAGEHPKEQLMKHGAYVRELLLDGMLVREGILDRRKLEDELSERPTVGGGSVMEIFDHIVTESWLQRWINAARQAAA